MKAARILRIALLEALAGIREREFLFWCVLFPLMWVLLTAYVFIPPQRPLPTVQVALVYAPGNEFPVHVVKKALEALNGTNAKLVVVNETECSGSKAVEVARNLLLSRKAQIAFVAASPPPPWRGRFNATSKGNWSWRGWKVEALYIATGDSMQDAMLAATARSVLGAADAFARAYIANISAYYAVKYFSKYAPPEYRNMTGMIAGGIWMVAFPMNFTVKPVKPPTAATRAKVLGWIAFAAAGMTVMIVGMINGAGIAAFRKENGSLKRLLAAPLSRMSIVWIAAASTVIEVLVASTVIVLASVLLAGAEVSFNPLIPAHWLAVAMLALATIASLGIGMLLSPLPKTGKSASGLGVAVGLPLVFIAGVWFPKFMLPVPLRVLANHFPVTVALDITREALVWGELGSMGRVAYALASSIAVFLAGCLVAVKKALSTA